MAKSPRPTSPHPTSPPPPFLHCSTQNRLKKRRKNKVSIFVDAKPKGKNDLRVSTFVDAKPKHHQMASLHILKSTLSPFSIPQSRNNFRRKSDSRKPFLKLRTSGCKSPTKNFVRQKFKLFCAVQEDNNNQSNGEEAPESLFMKELKRRGMTPTSLLEDSITNKGSYGVEDEMKLGENDYKDRKSAFSKRNAVSTGFDQSLSNQRETSMALNSEGLEGLIPRGKLLLTLGGTFFLAFWPLIVLTVTCFSALYLYFGATFVHDGSDSRISPPTYVDPYELLEDERISQIAPSLK